MPGELRFDERADRFDARAAVEFRRSQPLTSYRSTIGRSITSRWSPEEDADRRVQSAEVEEGLVAEPGEYLPLG